MGTVSGKQETRPDGSPLRGHLLWPLCGLSLLGLLLLTFCVYIGLTVGLPPVRRVLYSLGLAYALWQVRGMLWEVWRVYLDWRNHPDKR